ncbi:IS701 family transposase [Rhodococcus rhodochrous]|uniref:IS701 family transposase n=1 Tax=Rhodococcus rhodochrous TaxID=1829 RepID=A0AAW4XR52_RHORH|nr:IS701 family transposase [Rhodococcus rhodochrous]MCD2115090.1 IS701 family transposase [Rhodococcus rhodochrous]
MQSEVLEWSAGFTAFCSRFAHRFSRVESRRRMVAYVRGLLAEVERKNGWTLAEAAGDAGPEGMQRLLNFYAWDGDGLRDDVREVVVEAIGDEGAGVLIVDETGFLKKGNKSAGVARQYSGTAGRIENSQIGVFLAYASDRGRALIDRELYLPKAWTEDRDRCRDAGIDDDVEFATKPELAQTMLERALDAGIPFGWVTADEAYGQVGRLRMWLESRGVAHVLAVPKTQMVVSMQLRQRRAHTVIAELDASAWQRLSCGDGAHGPRVYDWAATPIRPIREPGRGHWLLARRSLTDPDEIAYYICYGPAETPLAELVRVAGSRWAIEECFQTAKNETGLDHYQVRGYTAWYRHITLSMAAAAFLTIFRRDAQKGDLHPVPVN